MKCSECGGKVVYPGSWKTGGVCESCGTYFDDDYEDW